MSITYAVHSLHINVQAGDSAVHLLLQTSGQRRGGSGQVDPNRPFVLKAILIDGGHSQHHAPEVVYDFIKGAGAGSLASMYEWKRVPALGGKEQVKFDGIIITHWDGDHWRGLYQLFLLDITDFMKTHPNPQDKDVRISFLRYADQTTTKMALSWLYAPNWRPANGSKGAAATEFVVNDGQLTIKYLVAGSNTKWDNITQLMLVLTTDILGMEFFSGNLVEPFDPSTLNSPAELMTYHRMKPKTKMIIGAPGMFCVAAAGTVLQSKSHEPEVVDTAGGSATNRMSIAAMVIWPQVGSADPFISNYFAGDLEYDLEDEVLAWSGITADSSARVPTVKASHHGSSTSFPVNMFKIFKPKNVIISAGGRYGHPRWELLMYFYAYRLGARNDAALFPTNYPYWFARQAGSGDYLIPVMTDKTKKRVSISTAAFDGTTKQWTDYQTAIEDAWEPLVANKKLLWKMSILKMYKEEEFKTKGDKLRWITTWVNWMWSDMSLVNGACYPAGSFTQQAVIFGTHQISIEPHRRMAYVKVISTPTDSTAGLGPIEATTLTNTSAASSSSSAVATININFDLVVQSFNYKHGPGKIPDTVVIQQANGAKLATIEEDQSDEDESGAAAEWDAVDEVDELQATDEAFAIARESRSVAPPPLPADGFYYCSDRTSQPGACKLTGIADEFVSALHMGWIGVDAAPSAGDMASVSADDELNQWLGQVFSLTSFSVTGSSTSLTGMEIKLSFAGWDGLTFTTDAVPWAFGLPNATLPVIPPIGASPMLYSDDMLILGLAEVPPLASGISLSQLCDELGMDLPTFPSIPLFDVTLDVDSIANPGYRNALWFMPYQGYNAAVRLAFNVRDYDALNDAVFSHVGLAVQSATILVRKGGTFGVEDSNVIINRSSELIFTVQVGVASDPKGVAPFSATLVYNFQDNSMQVIAEFDPDPHQWTRCIDWIENQMQFTTGITSFFPSAWVPIPRRVQVNLASDLSIQSASISFEIDSPFGHDVAFLFTFEWSKPDIYKFSAGLWPGPPSDSSLPPPMTYSMLPDYEEYKDFHPSVALANPSVPLLDLLPGNVSADELRLPKDVIPDVLGLNFTLSKSLTDAVQSNIELYAVLGTNIPHNPTVPGIYLGTLGLDLQYSFGGQSNPFSLALNFQIGMYPRSTSDYGVATLTGSVNYFNSGLDGKSDPAWQIAADVHDLKVGNLVDFFEPEAQDGVMSIIEHIDVKQLTLLYDYDASGSGNHFLFGGTLLFGIMELDLSFEHFPKGSPLDWTFSASVTILDTTVTIGDVLGYLTTDIDLPSFIGGIDLLSDDSGITLDVWKTYLTVNEKDVAYIVVKTYIKLGDFGITFIQYTTDGWQGPKRIFRADLSGPLDIPSIPVVDSLPQPFDELYFLYVQDKSGQTNSGILRQELQIINENLKTDEKPFIFKETNRPKGDGTFNLLDTIIGVGLRFDIVLFENNQPTVVLDHLFGAATPPSPSKVEGKQALRVGDPEPDPDPDPPTSSDSSMATMKKTFGPLTISNIGIQYKSGHLTILLDATFTLGPIELALLGFGLDLNFTGANVSLMHPPSPKPQLSGLGFGFSQPPLEVAGLFERVQNDGSDLFLGGVVVTFDPYLFLAAGCYGIVVQNKIPYKTVALYCLLEGPLIEFEFASIGGICGGFGYNSSLRYPTIDTVTSYPFITHAGQGDDPTNPLETINNLLNPTTGCITAELGSLWFAAGLTLDAFSLLNAEAVVTVEFVNSDVKLGIFAVVFASFPPAEEDEVTADDEPDDEFVYVELGIMATVDFGAGTMVILGQLSPNSFVFGPACHLTGGFGLAYWFSPNQHAGDWVVTIGGYHPKFTAPTYYPNPPRLGISWSLDGALGITGQAYFALTPNVAMGGGELKASLSMSPLYAWFDAWADFLIKFQPFYFQGDVGVDVGVEFSIDLWICTIYIRVDITAQLYLEGPPVHGMVHVDFWVFGFDIYFGQDGDAKDPVNLKGFYQLLKQQAASPNPASNLGVQAAHTLPAEVADDPPPVDTIDGAQQVQCVGGLITSGGQTQDTPASNPWQVRAGPFQFSVVSPFAMDSASMEKGGKVTGSGNDIHSRPMQLDGVIKSAMIITVTKPQVGSDPMDPVWETVPLFRIQNKISKVPASLWKKYTSDEDPLDPSSGGNYSDKLLDGTSSDTLLEHMLAVTGIAPKPYYPSATTEPLAAFSVAEASSEEVLPDHPQVARPLSASDDWSPVEPADPDEFTEVPASWKSPTYPQGHTWVLWARAMQWTYKATAKGMDALAPEKLVDSFDGYFMAAPLMTAAT